jgi:hypothetical protein
MSASDQRPEEFAAYSYGTASEPDIVPAARAREWMVRTDASFANRCLPLLMANESGWWLRNRHAFTATWRGKPARGALEIVFDDGEAPADRQPTSLFGYGILTWGTGCVFRTPPGVDLLIRGPANLPKDGISPLEGLVETDWIEVPFTMSWKLTRADNPVRFEAGEPYAMVVPQGRLDLERFQPAFRSLEDSPDLMRSVQRWIERGDREQIRTFAAEHLPELGGPIWDGSYMRGDGSDGTRFEEHRVRRSLQAFDDARTPR